ncbi:MAG: YtxH domain-containing protein [Chloroflexota bacterium]|jgi:gas vesicle protein
MNNIVSFILGAIVGAAVALLYAPQSGEELRANLREEAQVERQRLQAQYEKGMQDLQEAINRVQVDLQSLLQQAEEQVEETAESA